MGSTTTIDHQGSRRWTFPAMTEKLIRGSSPIAVSRISFKFEEGTQMWYIKVQMDEGTPS
jgi:hypothetical protein